MQFFLVLLAFELIELAEILAQGILTESGKQFKSFSGIGICKVFVFQKYTCFFQVLDQQYGLLPVQRSYVIISPAVYPAMFFN